MKYKNLFSPMKIGSIEIKNRIAMMPMGVYSPRLMSRVDGSFTKDAADYYIERAKGGVGLIFTSAIPIIDWAGRLPYIGMNPESYIKNQRYLTDGIHAYGAKVFIQMTALSGRASMFDGDPAPSVLPMTLDPMKRTREITVEEIKLYIEKFAEGAAIAKAAGIDGVEIHALHEGYLLDQFTMANFNHRTDEYGGSLENRLRFPVEIVQAIKEKCGKDYPVSIRYSVRSYMKDLNRGALPGEEFVEYGRDLDESIEVAKILEKAGYDLLNCDNGTYDSWYWSHPPVYMPKACNLEDASVIKKAVSIPIISAGKLFEPDVADQAIADGKIDMMGMARSFLADPEIVNKFAEEREDDIRPCIGCLAGCLGRLFRGGFQDICCALNPACAREDAYKLTPAPVKKKVAVVGGGIGGMEAARVCAIRGHEVHLFEKTAQLGGAFIAAAAFDFKEEDKLLLKWYEKQLHDLGIHIHFNTTCSADSLHGYDEIFIATGARERKLDLPGFDSPNVSYAIDTLLNKDIQNKNVVVIGGGQTGCEIAYSLVLKGCKVTIVEAEGTILNVAGLSAAIYNMMMDIIDYYDIRVLKNATVLGYDNGHVLARVKTFTQPNAHGRAPRTSIDAIERVLEEIPADHVIVSVGYISDKSLYEEIKADHVHLIGDAKKPSNLMNAIWSAYEIAMNV